MITLTLHLQSKWYDMIRDFEKREEYREKKQYWASRLVSGITTLQDALGRPTYIFRHYDCVRFYRGYTKECMTFEVKHIKLGFGNPAWGAVSDEECFVIVLGKRIK